MVLPFPGDIVVTYTALGGAMTAMSQGSLGVAARAPAVKDRSCLELGLVPSAVRGARHWAANLLTQANFDQEIVDAIVLLVSELVTNAIHAVTDPPDQQRPHQVWLAIERSPALVRVEVHDTACVPVPPEAPRRDDEEESGRGLEVIAAIASFWGWSPDSLGKVVWCELAF